MLAGRAVQSWKKEEGETEISIPSSPRLGVPIAVHPLEYTVGAKPGFSVSSTSFLKIPCNQVRIFASRLKDLLRSGVEKQPG